MSILPAVRTALLASATIIAQVGDRVHPMRRPQGGPLPAIIYQTVGASQDYAHGGPTSLNSVTVQVTAWADAGAASAYATANTIADAIVATLGGYQGTVGGVAIGGAFMRGRRDLESDGPGGVLQALGVSLDFEIFYQGA